MRLRQLLNKHPRSMIVHAVMGNYEAFTTVGELLDSGEAANKIVLNYSDENDILEIVLWD